jgi:hypothetical protein
MMTTSNAPTTAQGLVRESPKVLLIQGSRLTLKNNPGQKYKTITLDDIFALEPGAKPKEDALAIIPSSYIEHDARTHSVQEEHGTYHLLALDVDQGNVSLDDVEDALKIFAGDDTAMLIYSSSSASESNKKWRGMIPLAKGVNFETWRMLQRAFFDAAEERLGVKVDHSLARAGQPVYLPNVPPQHRGTDGKPLFYKSKRQDGPALVPSAGAVSIYVKIIKKRDALQAEQAQQAAADAKIRMAARQAIRGDDSSIIEAFNKENSLDQVLMSCQYEKGRGNSWRSVYQTGSTYATKAYDDGHWVSLSESDSAAGLGSECQSGRFGDAFDIYCHFEHGGKVAEAIKAYAIETGRHAIAYQNVKVSAQEDFGIKPQKPTDTQAEQESPDQVSLVERPKELVWPHMSRGKTPKPLNTLENFAALSRFLGVTYSMNVMAGEEVVHVPGLEVMGGYEANAAVTHMISQAILAGLPHALVAEYMTQLCLHNPFHPAIEWVESKPWDGVSRIQSWMDTITATNTPLKEVMMRKWAVGAVAALYQQDGVSAHGVLTLLGKQGIGKTSWFKRLATPALAKDGMTLRPDNPDSIRLATSYWMVELGELDATFRKSDIAALKSFLTSDRDIYRLPYARKNTSKPRQTVFFASVNDEGFLSDQTGNRRYWTIYCEDINHKHKIDMQQLWAEVKTYYQAGESWFLDEDQLAQLNAHNEEFTAIDPVRELLETGLNWSVDSSKWTWQTSTNVAISIGLRNPTRGDLTRLGTTLRNEKKCQTRKSNGVSKYLVAPKFNEFVI